MVFNNYIVKPDSPDNNHLNLVNMKNPRDIIWTLPNEFEIDECVADYDIELLESNYVDDEGTGVALFAKRKKK